MVRIVVVYKLKSQKAWIISQILGYWLEQRGILVQILNLNWWNFFDLGRKKIEIRGKIDLLVVLGGDGTMLGAVRFLDALRMWETPILGVNLGGLGFLTEFSFEELFFAVKNFLQGRYLASARMILNVTLKRDGFEYDRFMALNDIVINKAVLARIVRLKVSVDGKYLSTFRSDGLIISTPTGSTAYNLSAGGPICYPTLECLIITPICSFALSNRPLLINAGMDITVFLGLDNKESTLTCDGQIGVKLEVGDKIIISRANREVYLIQSPFKEYFEIIRTKLNWG